MSSGRTVSEKDPWRTLVQFENGVGAVVDALAIAESRKRAGMAKRLILEALQERGVWDLQKNSPTSKSPPAPVAARRS